MAKEIQVTATLPALTDGYGPDVHFGPQESRPHVWFVGGKWLPNETACKDPFFHAYKREPVKRVAWVNVYPVADVVVLRKSRQLADDEADPSRIACVRVEFDEGQFDD